MVQTPCVVVVFEVQFPLRDASLHSGTITSGYLSHYCLSLIRNQSDHSLTSNPRYLCFLVRLNLTFSIIGGIKPNGTLIVINPLR